MSAIVRGYGQVSIDGDYGLPRNNLLEFPTSPVSTRAPGRRAEVTLTELRYLVALANRGHFGRAAEDCHVSQPTLSTQIRKLEEYLGVGLIERNAKAFSLTSVGRDVVDKARKILAQVAQIAPMRRNVSTEDVGNAATFLCSDMAAGITGEILYVDNGFSSVGMSFGTES